MVNAQTEPRDRGLQFVEWVRRPSAESAHTSLDVTSTSTPLARGTITSLGYVRGVQLVAAITLPQAIRCARRSHPRRAHSRALGHAFLSKLGRLLAPRTFVLERVVIEVLRRCKRIGLDRLRCGLGVARHGAGLGRSPGAHLSRTSGVRRLWCLPPLRALLEPPRPHLDLLLGFFEPLRPIKPHSLPCVLPTMLPPSSVSVAATTVLTPLASRPRSELNSSHKSPRAAAPTKMSKTLALPCVAWPCTSSALWPFLTGTTEPPWICCSSARLTMWSDCSAITGAIVAKTSRCGDARAQAR